MLSAIGSWLELVGRVYADQPNEIGWSWFLQDYCTEFVEREARDELRTEIEAGLIRGTTLNIGAVLSSLESGFLRFMDDAEHQDFVRRAVLPAWEVFEKRLAG